MSGGQDASLILRIAGRRLAVVGDRQLTAVRPAFAGIIEAAGSAMQSGPVLRIVEAADPSALPAWSSLPSGCHRGRGGMLSVIRRNPSSVELYLPGPDPLLRLDASPAALASGDLRAQPAHHALAAWLSGPTLQMVHAGAVAKDGRGVLFIGVGGRGKTTTALSCARAGYQFLGDDLCLVECGAPDRSTRPRVHGLYATAKLNADSRQRLEAADWPTLGVTPSGKTAVALPQTIEFGRSAQLVAIVSLSTNQNGPLQPRHIPPRAAIHLLGSTALPLASGSGLPRDWLSTTAALLRDVPVFELGLNWDFERVTSAIGQLLSRPTDLA
jgi:hypothetical protein